MTDFAIGRDARDQIADIVLWPNPVMETVTIEFPHSLPLRGITIGIFSVDGELLQRVDSVQPKMEVNMNQLNSGVYLFSLLHLMALLPEELLKFS